MHTWASQSEGAYTPRHRPAARCRWCPLAARQWLQSPTPTSPRGTPWRRWATPQAALSRRARTVSGAAQAACAKPGDYCRRAAGKCVHWSIHLVPTAAPSLLASKSPSPPSPLPPPTRQRPETGWTVECSNGDSATATGQVATFTTGPSGDDISTLGLTAPMSCVVRIAGRGAFSKHHVQEPFAVHTTPRCFAAVCRFARSANANHTHILCANDQVSLTLTDANSDSSTANATVTVRPCAGRAERGAANWAEALARSSNHCALPAKLDGRPALHVDFEGPASPHCFNLARPFPRRIRTTALLDTFRSTPRRWTAPA